MIQGEIMLANDADADAGAAEIAVGPSRSINLKAPASRPDHDRRLEDWIAGNLDADYERPEANLWNQLVGGLPTARRPPRSARRDERGARSRGGWNRFTVVYRQGAAVVRMTDRALVKQSEIRELADDLDDLIGVGNQRVVLNFTGVERLGSWIVAAVVEAHRRCEAAEGGLLKVCGLSRQLAEIFQIIGMGRRIVRCHDEAEAINGPWPPAPGPRALPIDILEALLDASSLPPVSGGAPVDQIGDAAEARASLPVNEPEAKPDGASLKGKVWLRVEHGRSRGPMIPVSGASFVIGRVQESQLRLGSPLVSKRHAALEVRGGRVFLRDLGSTNGTFLNGDPLCSGPAELQSQDTIQIGSIRCTIWIGLTWAELEYVGVVAPGERSAGKNLESAAAAASPTNQAAAIASAAAPTAHDADPETLAVGDVHIKCEVHQDVLVVTPIAKDLEGDEANEALRLKLRELADGGFPRRVVVDLEFVSRLTRGTIGVLLAHHLRLDRAGGALRICGAHSRIMALLDQVRLNLLVDCFPCLDEAVLSSWTTHAPDDSASR